MRSWRFRVLGILLALSPVLLAAQSAASLYQQGLDAIRAKDYERAKENLLKALQLQAEYPEAFIALGQVFEAFGDDDMALKSYARAIGQNPQLFGAYFGYAAIATKREDPRLAWQVYSRIIQLDPKNAPAYALRGDVLLPYVPFMALLDYDQAIRYSKSESELAQLAQVYFSRGKAHFLQRRWQEARNDYEAAAKLNRKNGLAYVGLGRSYLRVRRYQDARKAFLKAKLYESDNPYIYAGLAAIKTAAGDQRGGQKYFAEAFARSTELPELYWRRAQYAQRFGMPEAAEDDNNAAVQLDPKNFEVYLLRGNFYQSQGRYEEALADYSQGISRLNGNLFKVREGEILDETELLLLFQYRGDLELLMGRVDAAMQDYQTLLQREVQNSRVYIGIGNVYVAKSQYQEALASYEKAVAVSAKKGPGSARPLYLRGSAKAQLGDLSGGLADTQTAVKLEPRNARAHYHQSLIYVQLNEYRKAEQAMSRALRYSPQNFAYYYDLALVQYRQNLYSEALSSLESLAELRPDYSQMYSLRAKINFRLGLLDNALSDADAGLQIDPQNTELYILRANLHDSRGESEQALEDYRLALETLPNSAALYRNRALLYQRLGQMDLALADIDRALALAPQDPENWFHQGMLLAQGKRLEEGLLAVNQALELEKTNPT
ncbi:MAG: tetratricopeptide repeat protein, partial [Spirochaetota bacterium]